MTAEERSLPTRSFPNLIEAALLMSAGWVAGYLVAASIGPLFKDTILVGSLSSLGLITFLGLRRHSDKRQVLCLRPFPLRLLPLIVVMACAGSVLVAELGNAIEERYPAPEALRELFLHLLKASDWLTFLQRFATLVVVAPVMEELVFRGIFQFGLVRNYGPTKGVLASAVCFGLFHGIPWQIPGAAITGILLGLAVYRTGSIFAGMALHAVWNLLPLLAVSLFGDADLPSYVATADEVLHIPVHVLLLAAGIFFLALRAFHDHTASPSA